MKKDLLQIIDKGYRSFSNLEYDKDAKGLFISYLLGRKIENERDEIKLNISFKGVSKGDIISQIVKYALICSCNNEDVYLNENYDALKDALLKSKVKPEEVFSYLLDNKELLATVIDAFVEQRYNNNIYQMTNVKVDNEEISHYIDNLEPSGKGDEVPSILGTISNLVFNKSRKDVLKNSQLRINHKKYSVGDDLFATIDRGNNELAQEDSVVIMNHPNNKRFKMIAVADGDSSKLYGELASNYILKKLIKWFEELDTYYFTYSKDLKALLEKELRKINTNVKYDLLEECSSTISVALVGEYNTVISTIGDTRLYVIKNNKVVRETKDDSYVETLCDKGLTKKEYAPFHKAIDFVNDEIGDIKHTEVFSKNTDLVPNDYDMLLIMTDGGVKLINDDKIENIILGNEPKNITERLVNAAKNDNVYLDIDDPWHENLIKAGESNVTAAMYIKRR